MDSNVVVGVGNIYASESLFLSGISPRREAGKTSKKRFKILTSSIKNVLTDAINNGGTTLNDFSNVDGNPGYFSQVLNVYGRENMPCKRCVVKLNELFKINARPITALNVNIRQSKSLVSE